MSCPILYDLNCLVSRSVVLTPSPILSACSGDELVVRCYEPETTANTRISLRWNIIPINKMTPELELPLSSTMNSTSRWEGELQFHAEFTSYSPLSAVLITTAHPALDGATVICRSRTAMSNDLEIRITQIGNQIKHVILKN